MEPVRQRCTRAAGDRASGFTLIELLVALAIAATVSAALVALALPDDAARAQQEARRLATLLEMAAAEARTSGHGLAWSPERGGYAFFRRGDDGVWVRISGTSVYRPRAFDASTMLRSVLVDSRELPPGGLIAFSPYGSQALIEATISGGNALFILQGGILGRVTLQRKSYDRRTGSAPWFYAG